MNYRYISTIEEFESFKTRVGRVFCLERLLPEMVFQPKYGRFRMSDAPDGRDDEPWSIAKYLLELSDASSLWMGVIDPKSKLDFFMESSGCYPVCEIQRTASVDDYSNATNGPFGAGDVDLLLNRVDFYLSVDRFFWVADDYSFAMYNEIDLETFVIGFHEDFKVPEEYRKQCFFSVKKFTDDVLHPIVSKPAGELNRQLAINYRTDDE